MHRTGRATRDARCRDKIAIKRIRAIEESSHFAAKSSKKRVDFANVKFRSRHAGGRVRAIRELFSARRPSSASKIARYFSPLRFYSTVRQDYSTRAGIILTLFMKTAFSSAR